jgi:hypothetical protein
MMISARGGPKRIATETERMSLTFKIALGVFLGVISAFLAINAPGWIRQSRRERWNEDARQAMLGLTPDVLIRRCGKPQNDVTDKAISTRFMYYAGGPLVLAFSLDRSGLWTFQTMQFGGEIHVVNKAAYADGKLILDPFEQVSMLPCTEQKQP